MIYSDWFIPYRSSIKADAKAKRHTTDVGKSKKSKKLLDGDDDDKPAIKVRANTSSKSDIKGIGKSKTKKDSKRKTKATDALPAVDEKSEE
jgi:hypothetical protein